MGRYKTEKHAIIGLHEKGFTEDFQMHGNDLLWVREQIIIRSGEFSILEYHSICNSGKKQRNKTIFGIYLDYQHVKGILIKRSGYSGNKILSLIRKKLGKLLDHFRFLNYGHKKIEAKMWVTVSGDLEFTE